ncbi:MAG: YibE/F family protein, partial [Niameybacter sp.]
QGTPMISILNSKSIASEVLHTFVGCIGLVIVCPLTATICSYAYKKKSNVI